MANEKILSTDTNYGKILAALRKQRVPDAEVLAASICQDAPLKYSQCAGFGDSPLTESAKEKEFGETIGDITQEKLIEIEVVNDQTIEYPNDKGEQELYAFDALSIQELGKSLEGVPIVIGKDGHKDADLPLAYFTDKFEVKTIDTEGHKKISLIAKAKVREDKNSPINPEEFFKNPHWSINGGSERIKGSLKFNSKDVSYFFEDGSKINYMTKPSPRHYAILDSPYIQDSGVISKNFGEPKGEEKMTDTVTTPSTPATPPATETVAPATPPVTPAVVETPATPAVTPPVEPVVEMVPKTELDAVLLELENLRKEKQKMIDDAVLAEKQSNRKKLVEQIVVKRFGPQFDAKVAADFEEKTLKTFGESELKSYLAALADTIPATKNLGGKGLTETEAPSGITAPKLKLFYEKKNNKN